MLEATQLHPPRIGPQFPINPGLLEMVRPYAGNIGNNVYPAYVGQTVAGASPPVLRDRVQVYLWAPNGEVLGLQWYGARLVSSYLGLPLYATWCCGQGTPFTGSSAAGPAVVTVSRPSGPIVVPLGGGGGNTPPPVTYTGTITVVPPDTPLVVTLTFTNTVTMVTTTVTTVVTGAIPGPFTYTYNGPLPVTVPGTYTVTAVVTTFVGQVVFSSSLLITVVAGSPSSSSSAFLVPITGCGSCLTQPARWGLTAVGVTNNSCPSCTLYNGNWTLVHNQTPSYTLNPVQSSGCVWDSGDIDPCTGTYPSWILYLDTVGTGVWHVLMGGGNPLNGQANGQTQGIGFGLADTLWNCNAMNTLAAGPGPFNLCATTPGSITVSPS